MRASQADTQSPSDESLMVRIKDGDHRAFATLVERHNRRFYAHAWRMVGNETEAEDIVQDCFLKLWRNPGLFDPARGAQFTTWFYRVITNAALDAHRKARPVTYSDELLARTESKADTQDQAMIDRQQEAALEAAIQGLPDRQRAALNLCVYEGLSNAQAADILGVGVKALESLLIRAKQGLRDRLGRQGLLENGG